MCTASQEKESEKERWQWGWRFRSFGRGQLLLLADIRQDLPPCQSRLSLFQLGQGIEVEDWVTLIRRLHRLTRQDKGWANHVGCNPSQQLVSRLIGRIRETGVHGLSGDKVTPETQVLMGVSAQHKIATLSTIVFLSKRPRMHLEAILYGLSSLTHVSTCTCTMKLAGFISHAYFTAG